VNGAAQSGSSIITDGWTSGSLSAVPGMKFTIAGVFKVNPSGNHNAYAGTANLLQFTVTQAVTDSTGAATIQFYPPLIPSGQFQNATNAPADNAAITFVGTTGQAFNMALAFQKEAYTAAFIKLHKPGNVMAEVMGGDESGTPGVYIRSIRQWQSSGPYAGYETERMDVIFGFSAQYSDFMSFVILG
jgi:hypothetical protein